MDWDRAIAINHSALRRIVAALVAMVGLAAGEALPRLPRPVCRAVLRILRPAEAAARRLIVIAARGVKVKPQAARPMPANLARSARARARASFRLFDPRKRFANQAPRNAGPRVRDFGASPFAPLFRPQVEGDAQRGCGDDLADATALARRIRALQLALDDLPRQAKRLKRWQARRARVRRPSFTSPLRPGLPPGHRKTPQHEVDQVLTECHALARDALNADSS